MRAALPAGLILSGAFGILATAWGQEPPLPRRVAREMVRVGGAAGAEWATFASPPSVIVGPDGAAYVLVAAESRVIVLDSTGRFRRVIGGKGEGPGEFAFAYGHGLLGDTLWVRNWPMPRMSRFRLDGTHLSTSRSDLALPIRFNGLPGITHLLRSGTILFVPEDAPRDAPGRVAVPILLRRAGADGMDSILHVRRPDMLVLAGIGVIAFAPFPIPPLVSVSPDGTGLVTVDWTDAATSEARIRRVDPRGRQVWERVVPMRSLPIPSRVRDSLLAIGVSKARPHVERERARTGVLPGGLSVEALVERGLGLPAHYPPVSALLAGADGTTWIRVTAASTGDTWRVLGETGIPEFEVLLPSGLVTTHATRRVVWGRLTDSDGVHELLRLTLASPATRR